MTLTRQQRRRLRKNAAATARVIAATTMRRTADGRIALLSDPVALATAERGFRALLTNNCRPLVLEVTAAEYAALRDPACAPPPLPGVRLWVAFGLDVDGRGTFSCTWTLIVGAPEREVAAEAERIALEHLAAACNVSGLPVEGVR